MDELGQRVRGRIGPLGSRAVRCTECGKPGEGSMDGWRALLGTDPDDEQATDERARLCPECAEREFGPPRKPPPAG
jgi:hypothetical protein